jgi:hypothetical protein
MAACGSRLSKLILELTKNDCDAAKAKTKRPEKKPA